MPWNGSAPSQTFARSNGDNTGSTLWQEDESEGQDILSSRHDTHDQDLADAIDDCLKKDGGNTASADIPMGGFTLTNIAAAGALTEPARASDIKNGVLLYYPTVGGTADAITLAGSGVAITSYTAGQIFAFLNTSGPNTGAATVAIDSLSAKNIRRNDGSATALSAADMPDNALCLIQYDGTQLLSPAQPGADLAAIEALSSTGILKRTGTNTWALTGGVTDLAATTANRLFGTDGSGNSGLITATSPMAISAGALSVGAASDSATGVQENAVQSEMEAASSTTLTVTPGRQHFHPGHGKLWAVVAGGASPSLTIDYNVTSITDSGTGLLTVTVDTDFSSADWAPAAMVEGVAANDLVFVQISNGSKAAGSVVLRCRDTNDGVAQDPDSWAISGHGDHA
jgi:hypothetical protein